MKIFTNTNIQLASKVDISAIKNLLNSAYRGESSKAGWTTEAHLIEGTTRTDEASLETVMNEPEAVFLKYVNEKEELIGCVNLQKHGAKIYLGMFSVDPKMQGGGIGKKLLHAAEEYAKNVGCGFIYMTVISVRKELIDWYKRHGYIDTGKRKIFTEDGITGKHKQQLEFMVLEKTLK